MSEETIFNEGGDEGVNPEDKAMDFPIASSRNVTVWLSSNDQDNVYLSVKVEPAHLGTYSYSVRPTEKAEDFLNKIRDAWVDQLRQRGVIE